MKGVSIWLNGNFKEVLKSSNIMCNYINIILNIHLQHQVTIRCICLASHISLYHVIEHRNWPLFIYLFWTLGFVMLRTFVCRKFRTIPITTISTTRKQPKYKMERRWVDFFEPLSSMLGVTVCPYSSGNETS